jgi:hypothetical protein
VKAAEVLIKAAMNVCSLPVKVLESGNGIVQRFKSVATRSQTRLPRFHHLGVFDAASTGMAGAGAECR